MKDRETLPYSAGGEDMWVFAYGSLMWNPEFTPTDVRDAVLLGYHRGLCIYSHAFRGTPEKPGLVFGLDEGGECRGRALKVAAPEIDDVVAALYEREMITNVYRPIMGAVEIDGIGSALALVFVADTGHRQYAGILDDAETARLISQGHGPAGSCMDYVRNTVDHLRELGIPDKNLERVLRMADSGQSRTG